ncbi:MAG TPA: hypothetical protein VME22_32290 [Solirubrobacteraceae bacterium]|nr:hypothetical protein [Solirubrobacteraceae bacterium]
MGSTLTRRAIGPLDLVGVGATLDAGRPVWVDAGPVPVVWLAAEAVPAVALVRVRAALFPALAAPARALDPLPLAPRRVVPWPARELDVGPPVTGSAAGVEAALGDAVDDESPLAGD